MTKVFNGWLGIWRNISNSTLAGMLYAHFFVQAWHTRGNKRTHDQGPRGLSNPGTTLDQEGAHRFIHYDPFQARVWELDGLESRAVEVWRLLASRVHRKDLFDSTTWASTIETEVRR